MKVEWSKPALADLDRFANFLQNDFPNLAAVVAQEIVAKADLIGDNPRLGRPIEGRKAFRQIVLRVLNAAYVFQYRPRAAGNGCVAFHPRITPCIVLALKPVRGVPICHGSNAAREMDDSVALMRPGLLQMGEIAALALGRIEPSLFLAEVQMGGAAVPACRSGGQFRCADEAPGGRIQIFCERGTPRTKPRTIALLQNGPRLIRYCARHVPPGGRARLAPASICRYLLATNAIANGKTG